MRTNITNKPRAGFTLIEILVAFAILGLAASAVLAVFSSSPGRISRAENRRMAVIEAQSILDLVGNERPIEAGEWQGDLPGGGRWTLVMSPYGDADKKSDDTRTPATRPYLVKVHASSGAAWSAGTADIETIRLQTGAP